MSSGPVAAGYRVKEAIVLPRQDCSVPSGPVAASFWADVPYFLPRQDPESLPNPVAASIVLSRTFLQCPHTLADSVTIDIDHRMQI